MLSQEIRRQFLKYFKSQGHTIVPSSSVVPHDDPTLLFSNAGMNQFKDVFLGKSKRDYTRACSSQKCVRVIDLDNVGHTSRHLTFFEMLGNFSFGDYFKKEAIGFAWDVTTHVFDFDPKKVWVSVYKDDDEAFSLWEKHIPASRIVRFGEKENFWSMGEIGPCGPCSELLYDRGEKYSDARSPIEDLSGERYLEFWNNVFMQFNKEKGGALSPLPKKSIDTGAGLERVVSLKLGVDSVFLTDILRGIIAKLENLSGIKYDEENKELAPAFNVISDHLRTLVFAMADGVVPSNADRGYVLRKLLRRATRYGRKLGFKDPFLAKLIPTLISSMGDDYPEITLAKSRCEEIITLEEESFIRTLHRGGNLINEVIENSRGRISASDAFKLKDTYGFPIEEILLIAKDSLLDVDLAGFNKLEEEAKNRSRKATKIQCETFDENIFADFTKTHHPSEFFYDKSKLDAKIIALLTDCKFTDSLEEGQKGTLILDKTPFYAEKGGQVGDRGMIFMGDNIFEVNETKVPYPGVIAHSGLMKKGKLSKNEKVHAEIDSSRRQNICNNHSATHLLHWGLSEVLGSHIKQAGSLVDDKRIRFDFNHHKPLSSEEIRKVEEKVNDAIRKNIKVQSYEKPYVEVQKDSAIKQFFGDKYAETVRIIDMEFSKELCGGCHTSFLGNIGFFKILKESSIAAGVRRIEAVTGKEAENFVYEKQDFIKYLADLLQSKETEIGSQIEAVIEENKEMAQKLKLMRKEELALLKNSLMQKVSKVKSVNVIAEEVSLTSQEVVPFINELMGLLKSGVIVLGIKVDSRCQLVIKVSEDLFEKSIMADLLIEQAAPIIQGGGGGKMDFAQAGGKDPSKLKEAFKTIRSIVEKKC